MREVQQLGYSTPNLIKLIFLLAVLFAPICSFAQLPTATIPNGLGGSEHNANEGTAALQLMYDEGVRYLRININWTTVETTSRVYNFSAYDGLVANANQIGIKVLVILCCTNPLYDDNFSPYDLTGRTAFANYAEATVAHYQGEGIIWEIYNEPDNFWTSPSGTLSASDDAPTVGPLYAALANATGAAIKTAYPNELVIGGSVDHTDGPTDQPFYANTVNILKTLFQSGACTYFNAVSIHPYRSGGPESAATDYSAVRQLMATVPACQNLPVVRSEWGYTSSSYDAPTGLLTYAQAEELKAEYDVRTLLVDVSNNIPISIMYDWMDDGTDQTNTEDNYGQVQNYSLSVTNPPITPLPAYNAMQTFNNQLNGYTYSNTISTNDPTDYIVQFTNGTYSRYVCWNSAGTANVVNVPVGANVPVTVTSFDGTSVVQATAGANGYACTESAGPQYIVPTASGSVAPSFRVVGSTPVLIINPGQSGTMQLTITPNLIFTQPIAFSCGSLPTYLTCTFSPGTVTSNSLLPTTIQLTISAAATTAASSLKPTSKTMFCASMMLGLLCLLPLSRRSRHGYRLMILALLGVCIGSTMLGCGGSSSNVPSGPTKITIAASAGGTTQTVSLVVVVSDGQ